MESFRYVCLSFVCLSNFVFRRFVASERPFANKNCKWCAANDRRHTGQDTGHHVPPSNDGRPLCVQEFVP